MSKIVFADRAKAVGALYAQLIAAARDLQAVFFARGYNTGGISPIIEGDLPNVGLSPTDLGDFVNLCAQLVAFNDGFAVLQAQWGTTAAKVRGDI